MSETPIRDEKWRRDHMQPIHRSAPDTAHGSAKSSNERSASPAKTLAAPSERSQTLNESKGHSRPPDQIRVRMRRPPLGAVGRRRRGNGEGAGRAYHLAASTRLASCRWGGFWFASRGAEEKKKERRFFFTEAESEEKGAVRPCDGYSWPNGPCLTGRPRHGHFVPTRTRPSPW